MLIQSTALNIYQSRTIIFACKFRLMPLSLSTLISWVLCLSEEAREATTRRGPWLKQ